MLKSRSRDPRVAGTAPTPPHLQSVLRPQSLMHTTPRTPAMQRALPARPVTRPEPDYEVVEFPSEQYVNAKLQPPPPPPPRPATGHPPDAGASCGLCGGGGARVRCAECGRRALCASCDDMYHRHPKRRHHQRQALSPSQLRDERPPLPPKTGPPVPPPRRHKVAGDRMSASPKPQQLDQRRATLNHISALMSPHRPNPGIQHTNHQVQPQHNHSQLPPHLQAKLTPTAQPNHVGSMPYLPTNMHVTPAPVQAQAQANTLAHAGTAWNRPRTSMQGFAMHPNMVVQPEPWDNSENLHPAAQNWGRPMRRGASVLELSGGAVTAGPGCANCAPMSWRYGSCASLDHQWAGGNSGWSPTCCTPPYPVQSPHMHPHHHAHPPQTPQPYRRADSRAVSRTASRTGSRAASPAMSVRSRTSRRHKHRTPSPPLPSSDADSESESESEQAPPPKQEREIEQSSLGPVPPAPTLSWQCEHCTYVNEPGVRVCVICCRTPTTDPKPAVQTENFTESIERLKITPSPAPVREQSRVEQAKAISNSKKERTSTGCGPSPPREANVTKKSVNRLTTPTREHSVNNRPDSAQGRHDMAVGPSPPRDFQNGVYSRQDMSTDTSPPRDTHRTMRVSPYKDNRESFKVDVAKQHSISVGPSASREGSVNKTINKSPINVQKKSTGTSPPRDVNDRRRLAMSNGTNVSNTGTSPPPQSISTQTYEVPTTWERGPSASRSRPRRRFRDEARRERSHSRHSLSSDTRESDRSVRTAGPGNRWEWRERDSSPGGEWGDGYNRLSRRASHLDLRRTRTTRRPNYFGSEAPSPERQSTARAISLEALTGAGSRRDAERGIELAQLMGEAERLGFSAAEVQAALTQSPASPLAWLRERWPSLCAGVRAAAARLAPNAAVTELEARAALARHRGAMWPAVTECVDRHRRQTETLGVGEEGRLRGHVWGSPVGADDDAAPPRSPSRHSHRMREDSSDEFEAPTPSKFQDDDWMYLPLNINMNDYEKEANILEQHLKETTKTDRNNENKDDVAKKLKLLLQEAGIASIDENVLLKELLSGKAPLEQSTESKIHLKPHSVDLIQSENDFIDAYNALTRSSPLPNINDSQAADTKKSNIITINKRSDNIAKGQEPNLDIFNQINDKQRNENQRSNGVVNSNEESVVKQTHENQITASSNNAAAQQNFEYVDQNHTIPTKLIGEIIQIGISTQKNDNLSNLINNTIPEQQMQAQVQDNTIDINFQPILLEAQPSLSSTKNVSLSGENISLSDNQNQVEEKSKNLSDMVDNTQKLIQQMKEEINSDINSIDGRAMSQSDIESSSEESHDEQESSYSDTENGTENLTSDEKEMTSSEDESSTEEDDSKGKQLSIQEEMEHIPSSEDNENFEEALDHVETQLEDFKNANIEMLDSIARTLQEEHSYIVQITEKTVPENRSAVARKQDVNNNSFIAAKNFDELYDELDNKNNKSNQKDGIIMKAQYLNFPTKESITYRSTQIASPTKLIIHENKHPILKAILIEQNETNDGQDDITAEHITITANVTDNIDIDIHDNSKNISQVVNQVIQDTENENLMAEENILEETSAIAVASLVPILDKVESTDFNTINTPDSPLLNLELNDSYKNTNTNENALQIDKSQTYAINNDNNEKSNDSNNQSKAIEIIQDKISEGNNRNAFTNKSSIPKLIKILPNNKIKTDKNSPKLLVSKVPIRRASNKQYPAPAPPKTHFGNIQSGHVKQLQTRLFNNKVVPSNPVQMVSDTTQIKPSTSTLNKKKQAPPPPTKEQAEKQASPVKMLSSPKPKKQYFKETCRTEDEWTESDSEDSQIQTIEKNDDTPYSPPSPPPPLTLRRVSGQLIDLAKVRLPEGSPERQARMLLAEGATETWEQAQLAVELISRGEESPAALLAALECTDLSSALAYLYQDCELCASRLPEHEMLSMLRCTHRCCRQCAQLYFTVQVTERSIADCVCPYCKLPELESLPEDAWLEYFAHLDILLKTLLEVDVHELFQRKLRDRTLARDPNFRWCMECSSGFFVHPKQKKIRCPECRNVSCASCRKPWSPNHEGLTCEQYTAWLEDNDPERSVTAIQQHLRDNGLECPRCHFKYSLSRGGCMHFTCTQCKYEFCYGCGKPFTMGARCGLSEYCAKLGLHSHHPRNCLFYLRDKEPHDLQTLLQMNNVTYETKAAEGSTGRCPVQLQRETPTGLIDGMCGSEAPANYAGLCKCHYVEYLAGLARGLDPIPIMDVTELVAELRRRALPLPERGPWDTDPIYAGMCAEIVKEKIPLD